MKWLRDVSKKIKEIKGDKIRMMLNNIKKRYNQRQRYTYIYKDMKDKNLKKREHIYFHIYIIKKMVSQYQCN